MGYQSSGVYGFGPQKLRVWPLPRPSDIFSPDSKQELCSDGLRRSERQLIVRVRGTMSQEQLSRRLGFASNVLYPWERQRRLPGAGVFLRMADVRRRPCREQPRHRPSMLAERLGLTVDEVEAELARLFVAKLVEKREGR